MPTVTGPLRVCATQRGWLTIGRSRGVPAPPAVARRTRRQRRIKTRMGGVCRLHLVGVGFRNAERFEGLHHTRMHPLGPGGMLRLAGRDGVHVGDLLG